MSNNLMGVNGFTLSGKPKMYKVRDTRFGPSLSIAVEIPGCQKWLWVSVGSVGPEGQKRLPFTEDEFKNCGVVTLVELKMDSYIDKNQATKYSTKIGGKNVLLGRNLDTNLGWCYGTISEVNPAKGVARIQLPYINPKGKDGKSEINNRVVIAQWPSGTPVPNPKTELMVVGSVKTNDTGNPFVQVGRVA